MKGIGNALRCDLLLARRSRGLLLLMVAPGLLAFLSAPVELWIDESRRARAMIEGGAAPELATNAYPVMVDGCSRGLTLLAWLLVAVAAASLIRDIELGTARVAIARGVSRRSWVLARFLLLVLVMLVAFAVIVAGATLGAAACHDFGDVTEDGIPIWSAAEVRAEIERGLLHTLTPLVAAIAMGLVISILSASSAIAVAVAMVATLGLDLLQSLLAERGRWLYASFLPSLHDRSYLEQAALCARGFSDFGFAPQELWLNLAVPPPEALGFLALALIIVGRRKL